MAFLERLAGGRRVIRKDPVQPLRWRSFDPKRVDNAALLELSDSGWGEVCTVSKIMKEER
jgi:hypothetical protein